MPSSRRADELYILSTCLLQALAQAHRILMQSVPRAADAKHRARVSFGRRKEHREAHTPRPGPMLPLWPSRQPKCVRFACAWLAMAASLPRGEEACPSLRLPTTPSRILKRRCWPARTPAVSQRSLQGTLRVTASATCRRQTCALPPERSRGCTRATALSKQTSSRDSRQGLAKPAAEQQRCPLLLLPRLASSPPAPSLIKLDRLVSTRLLPSARRLTHWPLRRDLGLLCRGESEPHADSRQQCVAAGWRRELAAGRRH